MRSGMAPAVNVGGIAVVYGGCACAGFRGVEGEREVSFVPFVRQHAGDFTYTYPLPDRYLFFTKNVKNNYAIALAARALA